MKYKIKIVETLEKNVEIESESEEEAILKAKGEYKKGNIVLDETNFVGVNFSADPTKQEKTLKEIYEFCEKECGEKQCCPEENCILFRIEKIMVGK